MFEDTCRPLALLSLLFVASLLPVGLAVVVGQTWPVSVAGIVVSAADAGLGWLRFNAFVRRDVALVALLALIAVNAASFRASGLTPGVGRSLTGLLDAVRAGISEELGMRAALFGLCVFVIGGLPRTRWESLLTYAVLVVPHAAMHFVGRPELLVSGTLSLGLVFGLPLAVVLRRVGIAAAIGSHVLIDAVRWLVIGA